jgi:cysteinyl-tRNA synthetase
MDRIQEIKSEGKDNEKLKKKINETKKEFENAMDDDFNIPLALTKIFELINETNKAIDDKKFSKKNLEEVYKTMMNFDTVLAILKHKKEKIPKEIQELIKKREDARKKKDFKTADEIRKQIKDKGYILEDTEKGSRVRKV